MIQFPAFASKDEEIRFMVANKAAISAQRKSVPKNADSIQFISYAVDDRGESLKADALTDVAASGMLKVRAVINTTNILDSHKDVHIPGIWKKNLQESKSQYHVQEHDFSFKGIISTEVAAFTKTMTWKDLGFDYPGKTQALIFDSIVSKDRNPYMFDQYAKGYVNNHSVRMAYCKEYFCINDKQYTQEYENWEKYIGEIVNTEDAEGCGYFWAVTDAKIIEGSAVVRGSNFATPTESVTEFKNTEAGKSTSTSRVTTQRKQLLNELLNKITNEK